MPRITYDADGFPKSFSMINGTRDLDLTWPFIVWSAISVGRGELLHIVRHGQFSLFEIVYRAAIIYANLRANRANRIRRSEAYRGLDPSEKSAISYFLGLTMAKAFAEQTLGVPWLMHLDVYREKLKPTFKGAGNTRPDLVGRTLSGQWVVIESKGRTHGLSAKALARAKDQASMVVGIGDEGVALNIGMVTHFGSGILQVRVSDPPPHRERRRIRLPLTHEELLEGYYRPFRTWLAQQPERTLERGGRVFRAARVDSIDATVGLDLARVSSLLGAAEATESGDQSQPTSHRYVGNDGILVELGDSWSSDNMRREPQARS